MPMLWTRVAGRRPSREHLPRRAFDDRVLAVSTTRYQLSRSRTTRRGRGACRHREADERNGEGRRVRGQHEREAASFATVSGRDVDQRCGGAHHVGLVGGLLRVRVKTNRKDRDVVVLYVLGAEGCHEVVANLGRGEACE